MSRCDRCKKEITIMTTTHQRAFDGGLLEVTEIPTQTCDCEEHIILEDSALIAGYARLLVDRSIIAKANEHAVVNMMVI